MANREERCWPTVVMSVLAIMLVLGLGGWFVYQVATVLDVDGELPKTEMRR